MRSASSRSASPGCSNEEATKPTVPRRTQEHREPLPPLANALQYLKTQISLILRYGGVKLRYEQKRTLSDPPV
jgi:hypothetical protein